jgi:hypothetical protein
MLKFFSNPWVGIAGSIASIVGIPLAVYLTLSSSHAPRLAYQLHPIRTPIVTAGQSSDLHVTHKATEISGSVSALQIAVWNAGDQPVRPEDVLSPIEVVLGGSCRILEASIRKRSRDEAQLRLDPGKFEQGVVGISWHVLEDGDGCAIQIVYNGDTTVPASVRGAIVGQRRVEELKVRRKLATPAEQFQEVARTSRMLGWLSIGGGIVMLSFASLILLRRYRRRGTHNSNGMERLKRRLHIIYLSLIVSLLYIAMGIYMMWRSSGSTPPFGF